MSIFAADMCNNDVFVRSICSEQIQLIVIQKLSLNI